MFLREILLAIQCDQRSTYCFILRTGHPRMYLGPAIYIAGRAIQNFFCIAGPAIHDFLYGETCDPPKFLYCETCDPLKFLYCGTSDPQIFSIAGPAIFAGRAIQKLFCIAGPAIHKWILAPGEFVCYSDAGPEILNFKNIAGCAIYEFFGQSSFPRVATETRTFSVD